jgi:hypothetical protein
VYWEAWTDLDGNHRFDGDLDDPDGGEPWVDANGNGRFDTLWLAGSYDGRAISAVHDDLMVTVTVFGDNEETVALAGVDVLTSRPDLTDRVRSELDARGVDIDSFNWMSSHTHESFAPLPSVYGDEIFVAENYWDYVVSQVVEATEEAYLAMEPASLVLADGRTPLQPGNSLQADLRDPSIIDNTVTMMRFDRVDDSGVIATIVHWGNHPEMTMWDTQASADFPGVLRSRLEAAYPGSVGVFLQGSVGDQITGEDATFHYDGVLYADEEGPWTNGSFEKAAAMGNYLADIVLDTLETSGIRQENCGITSAVHLEIYAAIDNPEVLSAAGLIGAVLVDADGKPLTEGEPAHVRDEVAHIAVCDLEILTNPSEVGPELVIGCYDGGCANPDASLLSADNPTSHLTVFPDGPFWKDYMTARFRMVTSLTNGLTGYLVDPATWMLDPVDPWGFWTVHHYDETASFSVKNAAIIDRAYRELLGIEPVPSPSGIDVPKAVLDRYVGNYADRMQVSRDDAQLVASLPRFGTSVELLAVSETEFVDRNLGLEIEFTLDEAGQATGAKVAMPGEGLVAMEIRNSG